MKHQEKSPDKVMGVISDERIEHSKLNIRRKTSSTVTMPRSQKSALAKFRLEVAPIRIDTGR